jgi:hypothetical protein
VKKVARDGQQCGEGQKVSVKVTPSSMKRDRFGVLAGCSGCTVSPRWWSVMKIRMFGGLFTPFALSN